MEARRPISLKNSCTRVHKLIVIINISLNTVPYSRKYWRALNLAVEPEIENIGGFKFGGSVRDRHTYILVYASRKFWRILIWRL